MIRAELQTLPIHDYTVCDVLRETRPSLCIDVGAAIGSFTHAIKERAPDARVIAVEAFPGNYPKLEDWTGSLPGVSIVKAAAGDAPGRAQFYCNATRKDGRSNIGYLMREGMKRDEAKAFEVDVVRVDSLAHERVGPLKIDVQGGEPAVLRGAEGLIRGPGIDLMFVEFGGDVEVLRLLDSYGYVLFDTLYLSQDQAWSAEWTPHAAAVGLTTGAQATRGRLVKTPPRDLDGYAVWLSALKGVNTDLIAVRPELVETVRRVPLYTTRPARP